MIHKEINLPRIFHELHGQKTRLSTLILVYLAGVAVAGLVISQILPEKLPIWKICLVGILYVDMGGGVVANLSTSTNQFYQAKPCLRIGFLLLHFLHPGLFILAFPIAWSYFIVTGGLTLLSALLVNAFKDAEFQQNLAATLTLVGIAVSFFFEVPMNILYSFAPLFMIKLILGFSVRRPPLT